MEKENTNVNVNEQDNAQNTGVKTYTEEEVLALIQSESDKRVTDALKTAQKKFDKQLSLAQLDGAEREKAEKDNKIAELEEKLAAFAIEKNRSELKSVLSARGLSAEFADIIVINDDLNQSQANIDKLDKLFKDAVKTEIEKRLAGNAPKGNGSAVPAELTKEQFMKLNLREQQAFKDKNPDAYRRFYN